MNGLPYYPRYPRDFFEGTAGMPFELKAAYGLVLDLIYMMGNRGLPDDPHFISGHLGMSVRKWNSIRTKLIESGKLTDDNGIISNKRADKEKIIQRSHQDKQRENRSRPNKNKHLASPRSHHTDTDTDTDIKEEANASSKKSAQSSAYQFQEFWDTYPHRGGIKKNRKGAEVKFKAALKRGVTVDQIMAGVSAMQSDPAVQRGFARDPVTWINQEGWNDEHNPQPFCAAGSAVSARQASASDAYRRILDAAAKARAPSPDDIPFG